MTYLNENDKTPIYCYSIVADREEQWSTLSSALIHSGSDKLCTETPYRCTIDATFLVDLSELRHPGDIKCDSLGSWLNRLSKTTEGFECDGKEYKLCTTYFTHRHFPNSHERIVVCKHGEEGRYALLMYHHIGGCKIKDTPHGNSLQPGKFTRTKPSTLDQIRDSVGTLPPREIFHKSVRETGGPLGVDNDTSVVRNVQQIYNVKRGINERIVEDELVWIMKEKNRDGSPVKCIHLTQSCNFSVFLATEFQLKLLDAFCTQQNQSCVLGVDMTYNCGDYYVTPTTLQHPYLLHTRTLVEPMIIGPTFIHTEHSQKVYQIFGADLINCNANLSNMQYLGSDRALEIYKAFKVFMPNLKLMLCRKHVEDNLETYLKSKRLPSASVQDVLNDIFLELCSALDESHFDEMLETLKEKWDMLHPNIYPWFLRYQAPSFKECMLQTKRSEAGLGEKFYFNNANESANNLLKQKLCRKSTVKEIVENWITVCEAQKVNCELAIISSGNYAVKASNEHLKIDRHKWYKMSAATRQRHIECLAQRPFGQKSHLPPMTIANEKRKQTQQGRKPNERPRVQSSRSIATKFCETEACHNTSVLFVTLKDNPRVSVCYKCRGRFKENQATRVVACTKTYRRYYDSMKATMVVSKTPQNVDVHLQCLDHPDFMKPYHICNYMHVLLGCEEMAEIRKHGDIQ